MCPVVRTIQELRQAIRWRRREGCVIGLVPTMGALHAGHARLIQAARAECQFVVASIFVNPTQFGPSEDFHKYPRDLDADRALCAGAGADLVFAPGVEEMYPSGGLGTFVENTAVSTILEGKTRPGHFRGVATVVAKLFHIVEPDLAYFGEKDYQQLLVIQRMVRDLDFPVCIRPVPTVREQDGLAMSSRNRYLSAAERAAATILHKALQRAAQAVQDGDRSADSIRRLMIDTIRSEPLGSLDYAVIADAETLDAVETIAWDTRAVALLAVRVGPARLIDNMLLPAPTR